MAIASVVRSTSASNGAGTVAQEIAGDLDPGEALAKVAIVGAVNLVHGCKAKEGGGARQVESEVV